MEKFAFNLALEEIWILVRRANKYVDEKEPWVLVKDPAREEELFTCMHNLAESLRIIAILIYPFMHTTSDKIWEQIGVTDEVRWEDAQVFNLLKGQKVNKGPVLFPRLDIEKELEALEAMKGEKAAEKEEA